MVRKLGHRMLSVLMTFALILSMLSICPAFYMQAKAAEDTTLIVHYQRNDNEYTGWNLWMWNDGENGREIQFSDEDAFGKVAIYQPGKEVAKIGFIVRLNEWEKKDVDGDRFVEAGGGVTEIWVYEGKEEFLTSAPDGAASYDIQTAKQQKEEAILSKDGFKVVIHYHRFDDYDGWNVWAWPKNMDGAAYQFDGEDEYGKFCTVTVPKDTTELGLIVRLREWEAKDTDDDRFFDLSTATKDKDGTIHIYLLQGDKKMYKDKNEIDLAPKFLKAYFVHNKEIVVQTTLPFDTSDVSLVNEFVVTDENGTSYPLLKIWSDELKKVTNASVIMKEKLDLSHTYTVSLKGFGSYPVSMGQAFDTADFTDLYTYNGDDLGAVYTKDSTKLRVWAPTAGTVSVNLYDKGDGDCLIDSVPMEKDVNGTWILTLTGDYQGIYYTYLVTVNGETKEAVDPYARTTGVNGQRAMIVDLDGTDPDGFTTETKPEYSNRTDAVIYELHVRDFSMDKESGSSYPGKFMAFTETGTKNSAGLSTGVDYLKALGITHLHLMPSFDYASVDETRSDQFNWGYDPENYNVPEGSYSTDPYNGAVRVNEFKQMVMSLHQNGLRVVMDVVYNHTSATENSNLNKIVPDYYYRKDGGVFSDASGCGNETASERAMVRKYIVDSVVYWATEYHVDGFRFDLMGIHDIETMNAVREALNQIDPSILIYGEGWTGGSSTLDEAKRAMKKYTYKLNDIAAFCDDLRDGIKGSVFNATEAGFATGALSLSDTIKFGVVAATQHDQVDYSKVNYSKESWAKEPGQCINYVSAHDNLALWDKINTSNASDSYEDKVAMNNLCAAIVLTSQGIPFFQAGEEMLRTKPSESTAGGFDDNSYKSSDAVNSLKWGNLGQVKDITEYYQGLIAFRKSQSALRMTTTEEINKNLKFVDTGNENVVAYTITSDDSTQQLFVVYNPNKEAVMVDLPQGSWGVYVDKSHAGTEKVRDITDNKVSVDSISCIVLAKEGDASVTITEAAPTTAPTKEPSSDALSQDSKGQSSSKTATIIVILLAIMSAVIGGVLAMKKKKK